MHPTTGAAHDITDVDLDLCRHADRVDLCVQLLKEVSGMLAGPLVLIVPPDYMKTASAKTGWSSFG